MPSLDVPLEILYIIFRHAVHIPGALVASLSRNDSYIEWLCCRNADSEGDQHRRSMKTKMSLILVSKLWFAVSIELLYEDIKVQEVTSVRCLLDALGASRDGSAVGRGITQDGGYGIYTKRFYLCPGDEDAARACLELFPSVAAHLSNLTILRIDNHSLTIPPILNSAFLKLQFSDLNDNLYFPHIHSLSLLGPTFAVKQSYPDLTLLELCISSSNSLSLNTLNGYSFPRLQHFSATYPPSTNTSAESVLGRFLATHGMRLVSLVLVSTHDIDAVNTMLRYTPHIEEVTLASALRWGELRCNAPVTRLGLSYDSTAVLDLRGLTLAQLPKLETIRLIDVDVHGVLTISFTEETPLRLSCPDLKEKVRIEDLHGADLLQYFILE